MLTWIELEMKYHTILNPGTKEGIVWSKSITGPMGHYSVGKQKQQTLRGVILQLLSVSETKSVSGTGRHFVTQTKDWGRERNVNKTLII